MRSALGLAYPGLLALRQPGLASAAITVLLLAALLSLSQLRFDDDLYRSFASGSGESETYARFIDDLGFTPGEIVALVDIPAPFEARDYERLRDMVVEFELVEGVDSVASPASLRFPEWYVDDPGAPVLPYMLDGIDVEARLAAFERLPMAVRSLVSDDRKSALAIVAISPEAEPADHARIAAELKAAADAAGDHFNVRFTGEDMIGPSIAEALQRDLLVFNLAGGLFAFVLAMVIFRDLRLIILAVAPAVAAALLSLSIFAALSVPVTVISNVVPILVLVLGLADSVHLTLHLRDTAAGDRSKDRAHDTITHVGPACALTAITTAAAFAAIALSDNEQLEELALVGALSVLAGYAVVIVLFALLALILGKTSRRHSDRPNWRLTGARKALSRGPAIIAGCVLLAVACSAASLTLDPWFNLDENLPTTSPVRGANADIAQKFGGFFRMWAQLSTDDDNGLDQPDGWRRLQDLTDALETAAPGYTIVSLATVAAWNGEPDRSPSAETMEQMPASLRRQLVDDNGATSRVVILSPEPMLSAHTLETHDRLEAAARSADAQFTTGVPVLLRHEPGRITMQLAGGLAVACIIATGLVAVFWRWPMLFLLLLLPNMLPLLVTTAGLHVLNDGKLTPTAMLALTIAFGIAIDDSIHFVNRYRVERHGGKPVDTALETTMVETGKAMVVTTLLICAGLSVTMASAFETVRLFGAMMIVTFLVALLADLMLLPALLRMKRVRQRPQGAR